MGNWGSSVSVVTVLQAGQPGFDSWQDRNFFLFATESTLALGSTQPPVHWVPETLSLWIKQAGHEADHLLPYSGKVKNAWGYNTTPIIHLHGVVLNEALNFSSWHGMKFIEQISST
jgi:hypothetical protein